MRTTTCPRAFAGVLIFLFLTVQTPASSTEARPVVGPLRIHPGNPRYFTDGTRLADGSLRAVYLTGSHTWANLIDRGPSDPPAVFDFDGYLDLLVKHHHNFIRLWGRQVSWYHDYGEGELHASPLAWSRTGPDNALDGKPKFDLTKLNQAYFDRLRARVVAAHDRGIYVGIMLFGGSYECRGGWRGNPFNVQNNINGVNGDPSGDGEGPESHTLEVPAITRLQEAYVRKVIDTVNDLDNVLYEISNEGEASSREWQYHLIRFIHDHEATQPKQHPVGMTSIGSGDAPSNAVLFAGPAEWVSPHTFAWGGVDDIPIADGVKVSLLDSDHWFVKEIYRHPALGRDWVWKAFCRGHHPILMEHLSPLSFVDRDYPVTDNDPGYIASRKAMGQTRRLAERMNLAAMTPSKDLANSGYCLASPGREYLIYLPDGGALTVDLSAAASELNVEWLDVENDKTVTADPAAGGGKREFTTPFSGAAALYLSNNIVLGIDNANFTLNGRKTFLLGASYYGALGAPDDFITRDLDDLKTLGFNWIRVWAVWDLFDNNVSAVDAAGNACEPYLSKLRAVVAMAATRGMVVDVSLGRMPCLPTQDAHLRAVETLAKALQGCRNVYFDLANERDQHYENVFVSYAELRVLRDRVKAIDPDRLVTASGAPVDREDLSRYLVEAGLDFICPHLDRDAGTEQRTADATRKYLAWMKELGRAAPIHYQEPFRRDYFDYRGSWQPEVETFCTDLRSARLAGAAGWCFHNGSPSPLERFPTGKRRSFDMRPSQGRLMDQLDAVELQFLKRAASCVHLAGTEVVVSPGQNIQVAVDANPPGTIFRIKAGVHRLQQVKPMDGDQFIGERGAVLCGAKVLPAADFAKSGDSWYVEEQTQRLSQPFGTDIMIPGYECDLNPEELFVNGDTRLKRVGDLSELGPGRWYFDYGAARIHLYDDPASFSLIETSAASAAFGGSGVRNVLLENLIIEKYGNPPNHGAVGSLGTTDSRFTYDWTCRYLTVRYNHGDGIDTGPGMTVENCKLHDNGQFGVGGSGVDERQYWSSPASAYKGRVTFRNNEVFRNGVLGYQRGWGAGGSKFAVHAGGTLVENCWFHDNYGPGIWFDVENRNTVIRSNLVENNGITLAGKIGGLGRGIFYEISFGPAKVYWNISRNNQEVAILNSNSEDVEIYENAVYPNGIMVSHDNRGHQTSSRVHRNDIGRGDLPAGNGLAVGIGSVGGLDDILPRVAIDSNTYRGFDVGAKYWWAGTFWSSGARTFGEWQSFGFDKNAVLLDAGTPILPANGVPFTLSQYGQR